jgi:hypothetical protein
MTTHHSIDSAMTPAPMPGYRIAFVAAALPLPTIQTQAQRLATALSGSLGVDFDVILELLPRSAFARGIPGRVDALLVGADIVIFVKPRLFPGFDRYSADLRALADRSATLLVSHPCDGDEEGDFRDDPFTRSAAHHVFALSNRQARDVAALRTEGQVFMIGHATRIEAPVEPDPPRAVVRTVLWENPVHHNPGAPRGPHVARLGALEERVRDLCHAHAARLEVVTAWLPPQSYPDWLATVREADIAIECKALDHAHSPAQLQKPAVKVLNYMALGLPVICDSLPAYLELNAQRPCLLFADSVSQWERQLTSLFESVELRSSLGAAARKVAMNHSIERVTRRLGQALAAMLAERSPGLGAA